MKTLLFSTKAQLFAVLFKTCVKKHLLTLLIICSLVNNVQATNSETDHQNFENLNTEWVFLKEDSGVKVYYKITKCEEQNNLVDPISIDHHETVKLKFINENLSIKSISFSKITTNDGTDEMETISLIPGTTIIESCESTAMLILSRELGDKYPVSVTDYLIDFKLTTNN